MYSVSLLLLLASANYPDGSQAATAGRLSRRQSTGTVELWGACNYPSQGINGPLTCADGSECICKDDSKYTGGVIFSHIWLCDVYIGNLAHNGNSVRTMSATD